MPSEVSHSPHAAEAQVWNNYRAGGTPFLPAEDDPLTTPAGDDHTDAHGKATKEMISESAQRKRRNVLIEKTVHRKKKNKRNKSRTIGIETKTK